LLKVIKAGLQRAGETERILYSAILERLTLAADGDFEPLVEGSAKPVAQTRRHAGNVKVKRYAFDVNAGDGPSVTVLGVC
jgi:ribosomal protein S16